MKLFTKDIDQKLFEQYPKGSDLNNQMVVAKIFNPYGRGTWYLLNSDPEDPDYIWAITDLFEVEVGSVSRTDLESIKFKPFMLGLERDLMFEPVNAMELYKGLQNGKQYAKGGEIKPFKIEKNDITIYINGTENDIRKMYLDYVNNFLTLGAFSEHYGISDEQALMIIEKGKKYAKDSGQYAKGGGIGFIPMDLEEDLSITAKWGGTDIKGVIGILNAMIDSGLTDEDLKPKPTKSGSAFEKATDNKTKEIWAKIEPKYKGDFKGNMYYSTIKRLVVRSGTNDDILKRFKPFRNYQNFANGGGVSTSTEINDIVQSFIEKLNRNGIKATSRKSKNGIFIYGEKNDKGKIKYETYVSFSETPENIKEMLDFEKSEFERLHKFSTGGEVGEWKKGDKVTDGRGNVGIIKEIQANGGLYIQWISFLGMPTRDITADNDPNDFEKLEYSKGGGVGSIPKSIMDKINEINELIEWSKDKDNIVGGYFGGTHYEYLDFEKPITIKNQFVYIEYNKGGGHSASEKYNVNKKGQFDSEGLFELKAELSRILNAFKRAKKKYDEKGYFKKGGTTDAQKRKVGKVMHEFKEGTLHSGKSGKVVKNPKQAVAIALSEAGLSKKEYGGGMGWKARMKNWKKTKK